MATTKKFLFMIENEQLFMEEAETRERARQLIKKRGLTPIRFVGQVMTDKEKAEYAYESKQIVITKIRETLDRCDQMANWKGIVYK